MKNYTSRKQSITASAIVLAFVVATVSGTACAQYPEQQTQDPAAGVPQQPAPIMQQPMVQPAPMVAPAPRPHPVRDLFAGTLQALVSGVVTAATGGIVQGVGGSINNWFARKNPAMAAQAGYPAYPATTTQYPYGTTQTYPSTAPAYPSATQPYPPSGTYPTASTDQQYGTATAPAADPYGTNPYGTASVSGTNPYGTAPAYGTNSYGTAPGYAPTDSSYNTYAPPQVYDPQTGQMVSAAGTPYAPAANGYDGTLYAGVAYEVHAVGANGTSTPIDPTTYVFRTGDKFVVYYRPSMPGRMEVFNINPLGQQTRIDAVNMAGGQLATLGPYQFTSTTGDEALRIVLAPCSSPELLTQMRDIVNVSGSAPTTGGLQIGSCGTSTRDIRTRDITKVALDGGTSFALDPVSQAELASGQLAPREVKIYFHHR